MAGIKAEVFSEERLWGDFPGEGACSGNEFNYWDRFGKLPDEPGGSFEFSAGVSQ